ncbi:MAG: ABC transporter permease, partial [Nitrospinota bacterium]
MRFPFLGEVLQRLLRNRTALAGGLIVLGFVLIATLADLLAPHDPLEQDLYNRLKPPVWEEGGERTHLLGTDDFGRDLLSRIIHGARLSLFIGTISVGISLVIGTLLGALAGFYQRGVDQCIMRLMDIMLAFPSILLAIAIVAMLGPKLRNAMIAVGVVGIPQYARIVRASVLAQAQQEYVLAARSLGAQDFRLIFRTILPNSLAPLIVQSTLGFATAILDAAGLSFLGLGAQPPLPEWGAMLS